jgi:hypothetical protein
MLFHFLDQRFLRAGVKIKRRSQRKEGEEEHGDHETCGQIEPDLQEPPGTEPAERLSEEERAVERRGNCRVGTARESEEVDKRKIPTIITIILFITLRSPDLNENFPVPESGKKAGACGAAMRKIRVDTICYNFGLFFSERDSLNT